MLGAPGPSLLRIAADRLRMKAPLVSPLLIVCRFRGKLRATACGCMLQIARRLPLRRRSTNVGSRYCPGCRPDIPYSAQRDCGGASRAGHSGRPVHRLAARPREIDRTALREQRQPRGERRRSGHQDRGRDDGGALSRRTGAGCACEPEAQASARDPRRALPKVRRPAAPPISPLAAIVAGPPVPPAIPPAAPIYA